MADFQKFVTPEQEFPGLYNLSNKLESKKRMEMELGERRAAKKAASDKYFTNYLDPKDRFTGTNFDPVNAKLLGQALDQAYELSSKGASDNEIFMAISPMVAKVNDYSQKAKQIQEQKKQAVDFLSKQKGIDPIRFSEEFDDEVFMETDPETGQKRMKDLTSVDPNYNYADKVLRERDIYTPEGFDEYVAKSGKNTVVEDVSVYNPNRSMRRTKAEMTMPSFMMSETDEKGGHIGFVPKYEIATDGDKEIISKFLGEDGKPIDAPVRMVTSDVFRDLPATAKGFLRQEAKKIAKEQGVPVNSPQVENFAKALAYDYLKSSGKQYSTMKEIQVQKAAPAPVYKNYTTVNNVGGGTDINNIYSDIDNAVNREFEKGFIAARFNSLKNDAQQVVKQAVENAGYQVGEGGADIFLSKDGEGNLKVYKKTPNFDRNAETEIVTLSFKGTNLPKQPSVKEKRAVISMGEQRTPTPSKKSSKPSWAN